MTRVAVQASLLRWARERARLDAGELAIRFPHLAEWEAGAVQPTLRQLEQYAHATYTPVGYLLLPAPPQEPLPIPDFRTVGDRALARPGANLIDTLYACQARQDWYREEAEINRQPPLPFVASVTIGARVVEVANAIRQALHFDIDARRQCATWADALRLFIGQAEDLGVLVMVSGVVMNNNTRRLDPDEFRGFALCDPFAPLIFINGADSKAAQMFTLAHELAHLWLGQSAISNPSVDERENQPVEAWCNQVAAELLVPMTAFRAALHADEPVPESLQRLARHFKVSSLVVLRRLLDAGSITRAAFRDAYRIEAARWREHEARNAGGGDFYRTTASRVSRRFARALIASTLEGRTLYRDAFRMLGISRSATFNEFGRTLGFPT